MTTMIEKAEFFGELSGVVIEDQKASQKRQARQKMAEQLLGDGLPQGQRDELRRAMNFSVERNDKSGEKVKSMDERGQRHSIETMDATARYKSIDPKDYAKVQAALEKITEIKEKMLAAKDENGEKLFTEDDLMTELYGPLVREGLMPDNLVIDDHSETAHLLKNAYKSYTDMLEKSRKKRLKKEAEQRVNLHGASDWKDQLKGVAHAGKSVVEHKLGVVTRALPGNLTTEETKRIGGIAAKSVKAVGLAFKIGKTGIKLDETMQGVPRSNKTATPEKLAKQSGKVLTKGVMMGIDIGLIAKEHLDTEKIGKKANRNAVLELTATKAAWLIEDAVARELIQLEPKAGGALDGRMVKHIKPSTVRKGVVEEQFALVAEALGAGFQPALSSLTEVQAVKQALQKAGELMAAKLATTASAQDFAKGLDFKAHPIEQVLDPFVKVAGAVAKQAFAEAKLADALAQSRQQDQDPVGADFEKAAARNAVEEGFVSALQVAAQAAAINIDEVVSDALLEVAGEAGGDKPDPSLMKVYAVAAQALKGRIEKAIDEVDLADWANETPADDKAILQCICNAFTSAMKGLAQTEGSRKAFSQAAEDLVTAFGKQPGIGQLKTVMEKRDPASTDTDGIFDGYVVAAKAAAQTAFRKPEFLQAVNQAQAELLDAVAQNNDKLTEEMEAEQQKTDEFERKLVLLDETGADETRQKSLAELIGQLEKDRLDLEIVNKVASIFGSWGTSVVRLGVDSSNVDTGKVVGTVATEVGQSLVPAMKAAQLVMQMSANVIQIYRRGQLAAKFEQDVVKARKSGSPLLPAIENFFNAKEKQQFFAKAELALQAVQLAGNIVASVPEPITMAVGRLITAIGRFGSAVEDVAEKVYTHKQLSKGWDVTLEALSNPKNRRAGLDALHINGTLAVHAVAWAAMENNDPIAREILRSCGVDAQTLADSASDQETVIEYLETRLYEDIEFKDGEKINTNWMPDPVVLSYPGWFTLLKRAAKHAKPTLMETDTTEIANALRALDLQPATAVIRQGGDEVSLRQLKSWLAEAERVQRALAAYQPKDTGNAPQPEMLRARRSLLAQADDRIEALKDRIAPLEVKPEKKEEKKEEKKTETETN